MAVKQKPRFLPGTGVGPAGKFDSTGGVSEQRKNHELVVRLMGEIGSDGEKYMGTASIQFLNDCRIKLNMYGSGATFGWRQVEAMVTLHKMVLEKRLQDADSE